MLEVYLTHQRNSVAKADMEVSENFLARGLRENGMP